LTERPGDAAAWLSKEEISHVQLIVACPSCNGTLGLSDQHVGQRGRGESA
jgi:hypothetical protein